MLKPSVKKKWKWAVIIIAVIIFAAAAAFFIYVSDYYRGNAEAQYVIEQSERVEVQDDMWVFRPESGKSTDTGFIFYPGGKVEAIAYAPLLQQLSDQGVTSVLVKMPFNLAVFDQNAAENVYDLLPDIQTWYIGGHSLGGAMASSYVNKHPDQASGLIMLGAYPVGDSSPIPSLAIYGSEDGLLDHSKLEGTENQHVIEGGNHAYFGSYGEQKGDGTAAISPEEQQAQTVKVISSFILQQEQK
ncbi:alpha/beta hydrolase [Paenibacillus lemnae]|uniref:Carboxymethylenebutenolidase n=1 Tax=Paenibacillus lemnae TaxID=1330551 RepID=A0A848M3T1_PAELE|nr:alpha/beta hydrolase [Paenibacillus lemnae]NMO95435.1 carboxymethylenebutenolidase [Paenibacillus lemnae]